MQVLYEKVEDGKLVNYDPSALAPLISQYLTEPRPRFTPLFNYIGIALIFCMARENLTPYLGDAGQVSQHPDSYQRRYFKSIHRHQYTNRSVGVVIS